MFYVIVRAFLNPKIAPKPIEEEVPSAKIIYMQLLTSFFPLALLILAVLPKQKIQRKKNGKKN